MSVDEFRSTRPLAQRMLTRNIPSSYHPVRAGVIPYTMSPDGVRIFYLCVDANYGDLTDASGSIGSDESLLVGAARELCEETIGIFDFRQHIDMLREESVAIYTPREMIIIQPVRIEMTPVQVCYHYRELYISALELCVDNRHIESSYLMYITEPDLLRLIQGNIVSIPDDLKGLEGIGPNYPPLYHRLKNILFTTRNELF